MKSFIKISVVFVVIVLIASCHNKRERQVQYMADVDMYNPVPYETYSEDAFFKDSASVLLPVVGTIARGNMLPFQFDSYSEEGYRKAKDSLFSPLTLSDTHLDNGKKMYDIYCASCHGAKGDGQGPLVQNEKILGVPNYKDRDITLGSIYYVIVQGKGIMGSHASQLTEKERWQITHYVEKLRSDMLKK